MSDGLGAAASGAQQTSTPATGSRSDGARSDDGRPKSSRSILRQTLIASAGGLVIGLAASATLVSAPVGRPLALEAIASAELSEAALSLDPNAGRQALDEARQCKVPLAFVTIAAAPGEQPGRIRIRSGSYLSPNITITNSPRRVAVPYPAPYATGRGVITVEGAARGLNVWLVPGRSFASLNGVEAINVVWTPKNPC